MKFQDILLTKYNVYSAHFYHNDAWWTRCSVQVFTEVCIVFASQTFWMIDDCIGGRLRETGESVVVCNSRGTGGSWFELNHFYRNLVRIYHRPLSRVWNCKCNNELLAPRVDSPLACSQKAHKLELRSAKSHQYPGITKP